MKKIIKIKEPNSLNYFRNKNKAQTILFENLTSNAKDDLRESLLTEQGFICCYCMNRVHFKGSKIEHFKPLSTHRSEQISYDNLFIACKGGEGTFHRHCDTHKDNTALNKINLLSNIENNIKYDKNGKMNSEDKDIEKEINKILNLNCKTLLINRKEAINDLYSNLKDYELPILKSKLKLYNNKNPKGKYRPFSQMIVYLLNKKIKQKE